MKKIFKSFVTKTLIFEASLLLKRRKPTIVAITGSVGKTTTKDAIYAAIKDSVLARKSEKSFNSEIGVPLTVLGLPNAWNNPIYWLKNLIDGMFIALFQKDYPQVLVLETGIDRPGDMDALTRWLTPDIVVLTCLPSVPVHVEYFSSPEQVVQEKMKLVSALKPDGVVVYNADDTIIETQLPNILQKVVGYSRYKKSDYTSSDDRIVYSDNIPTGSAYTVSNQEKSADVRVSDTIGSVQAYSGAAAVAVAGVLGISLEQAATSLSQLRTPNGRLRLVRGIKSTILIDDTYNSSPIAAEQALETLREVRFAKRKIAVLGDMLELGRYSSEEHERIGGKIPGTADLLLTVGVRARQFAQGALDAGMPENKILQYDNTDRAGKELQNILQLGDVVLVKASQGVRAEQIIAEVMAEPERAEELLVRQDRAWSVR